MNDLLKFLDSNQNKPVILVQGLGFVGSVMSLVCANSLIRDYAVIGVDLDNKQTRKKIKGISTMAYFLLLLMILRF